MSFRCCPHYVNFKELDIELDYQSVVAPETYRNAYRYEGDCPMCGEEEPIAFLRMALILTDR